MIAIAPEPRDVLVVEDDALIVAFIRTALTKAGHRVRSATTGTAALDRVRRKHVDVVLLDLSLPDIDGLEVLRTLRAERHDVPVVVLTARSDPADRAVAEALGVRDYLVKPVALADLCRVVVGSSSRTCGDALPRAGADNPSAPADGRGRSGGGDPRPGPDLLGRHR
ncbi:response regulator transcription factor [Ornithinimicrobium cryptoxanthini]|uniref:response regulator transcription factor n=1 Tax=Ornithinimicrobium cryptoxanthini TaxID=2934161 RepID=UPI00211965CF|nr:response regulator [Ornithinimicrobium cryptoxanthini]